MRHDLPPKTIEGPSAWIGEQLARNPEDWLTLWSSQEIDELETAADNFLKKSQDLATITKENFPLPGLREKFKLMQETLINGI